MRWSHRSVLTPRSCADARRRHVLAALLCALSLNAVAPARGEGVVRDAPIRVRIAYGADRPIAWRGEASATEAELTDLRALPVAPDVVGGAWEDDGRVAIAHAAPTLRGAFDVTLSRRDGASLRLRIDAPDGASSIDTVFTSAQLAMGKPLASRGSNGLRVVAQRLPDDRLRIVHDRDDLIFSPGEAFRFEVQADPPEVEPGTAYELQAELTHAASGRVVWTGAAHRVDAPIDGLSSAPIEIPLPADEGAYRVALRVTRPSGFAARFRVGGAPRTLAERAFQVVVFDAEAPATRPGELREAYAFDPASPKMSDRLPEWTGWRRLPWFDAGPFGNLSGRYTPPVRDGYVEIAPSGERDGANWQAYPLAIPATGRPCLIEVEYPTDAPQRLGLAVFDDAGEGRLSAVGDGVITQTPRWGASDGAAVARFVCWPRTEGPLLVLHNPSPDRPARFGRVRVLQADAVTAPVTDANRDVLLDFDDPVVGRFVGVEGSGPDRGDALRVAKRLADRVEIAGGTGAVVTVNRNGAAIYATDSLGRSTRYDQSVWRSGADDLPRWSQLDLLLREFSRRGLRLRPAIDFDSTPSSVVRAAALSDDPTAAGPANTVLDDRVREAMRAAIDELRKRCESHSSFAGVAVRLGANSSLVTAGENGDFSATVVDRFLVDQGLRWPEGAPRGPEEHAAAIRDGLTDEWDAWRRAQVESFYGDEAPLVLGRDLHKIPLLAARATPRLGAETALDEDLSRIGVDAAPIARPWTIALDRPLDRLATDAESTDRIREQLESRDAGSPARIGAATASVRLIDAVRWFGADVDLRCVSAPPSTERQILASVLADPGDEPVVDAGPATVGWCDDAAIDLRRALARSGGELATLAKGGVHARTEVAGDDTRLVVVNRSPWTAHGAVMMEVGRRCLVTPLDGDGGSGEWRDQGVSPVKFDLAPYESRAWRFAACEAVLTGLGATHDPSAESQVAERLRDFQRRDRTARRAATPPANASFEAIDGTGAATDWQVIAGSAASSTAAAKRGARSVALSSDGGGAEIESTPFPAPATGQFVVSIGAKPVDFGGDSQLRITIEQVAGDYAVQTTVPSENLAPVLEDGGAEGWRDLIFAVDDLPLGDASPLRMRVSIVGAGEVLLDDVRTESLKLPLPSYADDNRAQNLALIRLQRAAEQALEEERLNDCRELLDSYWARFVTEYFPLAPEEPTIPSSEATAAEEVEPDDAQEPSVADRWRRYLPSFLR